MTVAVSNNFFPSMADRLAQYSDGLISFNEMITALRCCRSVGGDALAVETPIEAAPDLAMAFTEIGIAALKTRVQATREVTMYCTKWTVNEAGTEMSGNILLNGDDVVPGPNDHEWLMPSLHFPLPLGSIIGPRLAEQHRKLEISTFEFTNWLAFQLG